MAPASAQALPGRCLPVEEEEDKGHFAPSPLDFSIFLKTNKNRAKNNRFCNLEILLEFKNNSRLYVKYLVVLLIIFEGPTVWFETF